MLAEARASQLVKTELAHLVGTLDSTTFSPDGLANARIERTDDGASVAVPVTGERAGRPVRLDLLYVHAAGKDPAVLVRPALRPVPGAELERSDGAAVQPLAGFHCTYQFDFVYDGGCARAWEIDYWIAEGCASIGGSIEWYEYHFNDKYCTDVGPTWTWNYNIGAGRCCI